MADHDVRRIDAGVLEDVELFERRLPGNAGMGEDRDVRGHVRAAHGAEHLPLVLRNLIPRSDLAKRTDHIVVRLLDERFDDLILAHRRDLLRIPRLRVETAADDDRHARLHRDLADEVDVAPHLGVSGFDDAGDVAFGGGLLHFRRHQVDVVHDVGRGRLRQRLGRRRRRAPEPAAGRCAARAAAWPPRTSRRNPPRAESARGTASRRRPVPPARSL